MGTPRSRHNCRPRSRTGSPSLKAFVLARPIRRLLWSSSATTSVRVPGVSRELCRGPCWSSGVGSQWCIATGLSLTTGLLTRLHGRLSARGNKEHSRRSIISCTQTLIGWRSPEGYSIASRKRWAFRECRTSDFAGTKSLQCPGSHRTLTLHGRRGGAVRPQSSSTVACSGGCPIRSV